MDVLIGECIDLTCIIFSISILNWVVGYRKYSDIDFLKNIVIQATIIIVLYIVSRYISLWNIAILDNNINQHSAIAFNLIELIRGKRISNEKAIWIISNIVIMIGIIYIYSKVYKLEWKKFTFLYILTGQYISMIENSFLSRFLFTFENKISMSSPLSLKFELHDWNIFNIKIIIIAIIIWISVIILDKLIDRFLKNKIYRYSINIIMLNFVYIILMQYVIKTEKYGINRSELYIIITKIIPMFTIISTVIILYIILEIKKQSEEKVKEKEMYTRLESKNDYYEKLEKSQEDIRRLYHDMNNHLYAIKNMNKNKSDSLEYIESIQNELNKANQIKASGNAIFDIIVDEKMKICENKGIEFILDLDSKNTGFIENIDMSSILGNILDNAIEACDKIENSRKYINLKSMWAKNMFVFICENSKENDVKKVEGRYITSKNDKSKHGIGIKSVEASVKKYNGKMNIFCDENTFRIKVVIPKN